MYIVLMLESTDMIGQRVLQQSMVDVYTLTSTKPDYP